MTNELEAKNLVVTELGLFCLFAGFTGTSGHWGFSREGGLTKDAGAQPR